MQDEELRKQVKLLKALYNIPYNKIADCLGIKHRSMYNWLQGQYNMSYNKKWELNKYLLKYKGE